MPELHEYERCQTVRSQYGRQFPVLIRKGFEHEIDGVWDELQVDLLDREGFGKCL